MKKFALLGFGGLGKSHFKRLLQIEKERGDIQLVAIIGADKKTLAEASKINIGTTDLSDVDFTKYNFYDTVDEFLEKEPVDFVISVLPSTMHAEVSIRCMEKGIDVFSEKPMALNVKDCERMVATAKKTGRLLMIGQCLRYNGAYQKMKEYIDTGVFGKVVRAEFQRYSQLPIWTFNNWILDRKQSGGAPLDFHCHDVDLVNHFFGMPKEVSSVATHNKAEFESIFTRYTFDDDKVVTAHADWSFPQSFPFRSHLLVLFEKAAVEILGDVITVYEDEKSYEPDYDREDHFIKEFRDFIDCVVAGKESEISQAYSVMNSVKIVDAEIRSVEKKKVIKVK